MNEVNTASDKPAASGAMLPLVLSLIGSLVVAALAVDVGVRMDNPPPKPKPPGPLPNVAGPGRRLAPERGVRGRLVERICRSNGQPYQIYVPYRFQPERRHPLVISLPDAGEPADEHAIRWADVSDSHRYLVLIPQVTGQGGLLTSARRRDQTDGLAGVLDEAVGDWDVDSRGILLAGWGSGGLLAHRWAGEQGRRFVGFAAAGACFSEAAINERSALRNLPGLPIYLLPPSPSADASLWQQTEQAERYYRGLECQVVLGKAPAPIIDTPIAGLIPSPVTVCDQMASFFEWQLGRTMPAVRIVFRPRLSGPEKYVSVRASVSSRFPPVRLFTWDFGKLAGPSYAASVRLPVPRDDKPRPIKLTVKDTDGHEVRVEAELVVPRGQPADPAQDASRDNSP